MINKLQTINIPEQNANDMRSFLAYFIKLPFTKTKTFCLWFTSK